MKKIVVLVFCTLFLFCSLASAARINMRNKDESPPQILTPIKTKPKIAWLWTAVEQIKADKKNETIINEKLEKKFPKSQYEFVADRKVHQDLFILADDRSISNLDQLKREDFVSIGKKYGYDYVIVLPFYSNSYEYTGGAWSTSFRVNITLKARVVDVNTGEYLYRMDIVEKGATSATFGNPSYSRAQRNGIGECVDTFLSELSIGKEYAVEEDA